MYKIKSIKFDNHPLFKNQKFDFYEGDKTFSNIIFAGPNGSKKTKLLEEIRTLANHNYNDIVYTNEKSSVSITYDLKDFDLKSKNGVNIDELTIEIHFINGNISRLPYYYNNDKSITHAFFSSGEEFVYNSVKNSAYSPVNINYNSSKSVSGVTNMSLDEIGRRESNDVAYNVNQLLVDVSNQDAINLSNYAQANPNRDSDGNIIVPESLIGRYMKRFTNSFNYMFDDVLKFNGITNNSIPVFMKNGVNFLIGSLSSGEKQIVFRGVELLKNISIIKDKPVFIDEPELSMHPKWEDKILNYYKLIFSDNGVQMAQMFVATHSEHILKESLNDDDSLVIKLGDNGYEKYYKNGPGIHLPVITIGEIKFDIFDVYTIDFHIELYGFLQANKVPNLNDPTVGETDKWLVSINAPLKEYNNGNHHYKTLPTYIRNCIDHPNPNNSYSEEEIKQSIDYMLTLI